MTQVHTKYGPGQIVASETVHGRTSYKVEGSGWSTWIDARVADINPSSTTGDIGPDPGVSGSPGDDAPQADAYTPSVSPTTASYHEAWAPVDREHSVTLPYNPRPQYTAIPSDVESTIQPIHHIDPEERLSPADSISFESRGQSEGGPWPKPNPDLFAKSSARYAGWQHDPEGHEPGYGGGGNGLEPDYEYNTESGYPEDDYGDEGPLERYPSAFDREPAYRSTFNPHHDASIHEAMYRQGGPAAAALPILEALGGGEAAGVGAAEAGEGAGAAGEGAGIPRSMLPGGGGGGDDEDGSPTEAADEAIDALSMGQGWGPLVKARLIDSIHEADYHHNPIAQFAHDPVTFIERHASTYQTDVDPDIERYGMLVEADPQIREAAWRDVRQKAMRLRHEGNVQVNDIAPDRIYATVKGDHGVYDVMIAKSASYGGLGGGHQVSNWHCGCEWGKWAFQRRYSYIGRLCSHAYAAYLDMQSAHMRGKPRQQRLDRAPKRRKRADALQNIPQRLVPELVVNDTDDTQQMLDVTKDERDTTGPQDIMHFSSLMVHCDRTGAEYPRELVAFLERYAEDEKPSDWEVHDFGEAKSDLNKIRNFADDDAEDYYGDMDDRNDQVRDAIEDAREKGVDADQLVAFRRTAAPGDVTPDDPLGLGIAAPAGGSINPGYNINSPSAGSPTPDDPYGLGIATPEAGGADNPNPGIGNTPTKATPGSPFVTPTTAPINTAPGSKPPAQVNPGPASPPANPSGAGAGGGGQGGWPKGPAGGTYTVQSGDTLSGIAESHGMGGNYQSLVDAIHGPLSSGTNLAKDPNLIHPGDVIPLPKAPAVGGGTGGGKSGWDGHSLGGGSGSSTPNAAGAAASTSLKGSGTAGASGGDLTGGGTGGKALALPGAPAGGFKLSPDLGLGSTGKSSTASRSRRFERDVLAVAGFRTAADPADPNAADPNVKNVDATPKPPSAVKAPPAAKPTAPGAAKPGEPSLEDVKKPGDQTKDPNDPTQSGLKPTNPPGGLGSGGMGGLGGMTGDELMGGAISGLGGAIPAVTEALPSIMQSAPGIAQGIGGLASGLMSGLGHIFGSQQDVEDWKTAAFPGERDALPHDRPFEGFGPAEPIAFTDSASYVDDNERDRFQDVSERPDDGETNEKYRTSTSGGIRRKGRAPRTVIPEVVREVRPTKGQHVAAAELPEIDDPYSRTAAHFSDDEPMQMTASNDDYDPVAAFHASPGAQEIMGSSGGGRSDYDDIAASANAHLQKTAGRKFSPADETALIREGDIGGAGNLDELDLAGTHYSAKDSVGLW